MLPSCKTTKRKQVAASGWGACSKADSVHPAPTRPWKTSTRNQWWITRKQHATRLLVCPDSCAVFAVVFGLLVCTCAQYVFSVDTHSCYCPAAVKLQFKNCFFFMTVLIKLPLLQYAAALKPYICGGTSACFASFCIHPIDVTKVRLQVFIAPTRFWKHACTYALSLVTVNWGRDPRQREGI